MFRHESKMSLMVEPSVYLDSRQMQPRASRQIVLSGAVDGPLTRIRWSLSKAHDTAIAIRDLRLEELR